MIKEVVACAGVILGQAVPISPEASPWFSIMLQGGAFALLAYIVVVAYPNAAADSRKERENRDEKFSSMLNLLNQKFDERNMTIVTAVERQTGALSATFQAGAARIESAVNASCKHKG